MQHFEKLLSPSEYDRQLEPNCPIDFETNKKKWFLNSDFQDCVSDQKM